MKTIIKPFFFVLQLFLFCTLPPSSNQSETRYKITKFKEVTNIFKTYVDTNSIENRNKRLNTIYMPDNSFSGTFTFLGIVDTVSDAEIDVINAHYQNQKKEYYKKLFRYKALLESDGIKAWFCFQEDYLYDLRLLKHNSFFTVLYQFVGSTNVDSERHFVFVVTSWVELKPEQIKTKQ
jgi:hypothetical protein